MINIYVTFMNYKEIKKLSPCTGLDNLRSQITMHYKNQIEIWRSYTVQMHIFPTHNKNGDLQYHAAWLSPQFLTQFF